MKLHFYVLFAVLLVACVEGFRLMPKTRLLRNPSPYTSSIQMMAMGVNGKVTVGIVGASGAVGEEILKVMENRKFPASSVKLFASERSAGKTVESNEFGKLTFEAFSLEAASTCDVCLLAVDGDFSKVHTPIYPSMQLNVIFFFHIFHKYVMYNPLKE